LIVIHNVEDAAIEKNGDGHLLLEHTLSSSQEELLSHSLMLQFLSKFVIFMLFLIFSNWCIVVDLHSDEPILLLSLNDLQNFSLLFGVLNDI